MKRFLAHLIAALGAAFGTASLAHAKILIVRDLAEARERRGCR